MMSVEKGMPPDWNDDPLVSRAVSISDEEWQEIDATVERRVRSSAAASKPDAQFQPGESTPQSFSKPANDIARERGPLWAHRFFFQVLEDEINAPFRAPSDGGLMAWSGKDLSASLDAFMYASTELDALLSDISRIVNEVFRSESVSLSSFGESARRVAAAVHQLAGLQANLSQFAAFGPMQPIFEYLNLAVDLNYSTLMKFPGESAASINATLAAPGLSREIPLTLKIGIPDHIEVLINNAFRQMHLQIPR